METNEERRRRKLEALIKHYGAETIATKAKLNSAYLDQIVKKRLLPMKADGTRSARTLAEDAARRLEEGLGLATGWLDWPLDGVPLTSYYALTERERGEFEARAVDLIDEIIAKRSKRSAA